MAGKKSSIQAANNGELAEKLGVSRVTLYAWKKQPGAPVDLDLEKWLAFAQTVARKAAGSVKQAKARSVKSVPPKPTPPPRRPAADDEDDGLDELAEHLQGGDDQARKLAAEARRAELAGDKLEIEIGELRKRFLPSEQVAGAVIDACTRLKSALRRNETEIPGQVAGKDERAVQVAIAEGNDRALAVFLAQVKKLLAGEEVPL